jgi:hypothetical protein
VADDPATVLLQSAEDWLKALSKAMMDRRNGRQGAKVWAGICRSRHGSVLGLDLLNDYLEGDPPLLNYQAGWDELFRVIARLGRLNVAELIINAKSSKMKLNGFRTAAQADDLGDEVAARIMQANNLTVKSREVHDFQLWAADGYMMVTPPLSDGGIPIITSEDPRETITAHDPATGITRAGLKLFRDEWDAADLAHLYIRQDGTRWCTTRSSSGDAPPSRGACSGSPAAGSSPPTREAHPDAVGSVPEPRWPRRVRTAPRHPRPDQRPDHVEGRHREGAGVPANGDQGAARPGREDRPDGTATSRPSRSTTPTRSRPPRVAVAAARGREIWESTPTDLGPLRLSIKDDLENLAAVTQTALPAITPDAASGSAEGAALMREEHVGAVEACWDYAEAGWAEVMSAAFAFMGDEERADISQIKPIRGPIERFSLTERASAASQAVTTLPREAIQTDIWQYPPAEVARLRQQQGADLLTQPAPTNGVPPVTFQPPGQPPQTGAPGGPAAQ